MAITNPTKYVSVRRLNRFKAKLANEFMSKNDAIGSLPVAVAPDPEQSIAGANGLMSKEDKAKLDGIEEGATATSTPDWDNIENKPQTFTPSSHNHTKSEISDFPTLGDAAAKGVVTTVDSSADLPTSGAVKTYVDGEVKDIEDLIPSQATDQNQLADKDFVNSSIATATATFKGTFNLVSDLSLTISATNSQIASKLASTISGEDNNDYAFVQVPTSNNTPTQIAKVVRFKYNGTSWEYEYELNNSGFTAAQWAALNSGITSSQVSTFSNKYSKPSGGIPKSDLSYSVQTTLTNADAYCLIPVNVAGLTPSSTFVKNNILGINGTLYRATQATSNFPVTLLTSGGSFVTNTINGKTAFVVSDYTLNTGWEIWSDASMEYWAELISQGLNSKQDTISDLSTIRNGASAGASAYQKPSGGIPKTDLASAVQTSLGKADTALQNHRTPAENGFGYGTCGTAASTKAKVVTLSSYVARTGGIIAVKFTYNVPASATLNVNSQGAYNIRYKGSNITASVIQAGDTATFVFDGSYYHLLAIDVAIDILNGLRSATVVTSS